VIKENGTSPFDFFTYTSSRIISSITTWYAKQNPSTPWFTLRFKDEEIEK
jgi:hypothetical protein